jgi:hypothetical protein
LQLGHFFRLSKLFRNRKKWQFSFYRLVFPLVPSHCAVRVHLSSLSALAIEATTAADADISSNSNNSNNNNSPSSLSITTPPPHPLSNPSSFPSTQRNLILLSSSSISRMSSARLTRLHRSSSVQPYHLQPNLRTPMASKEIISLLWDIGDLKDWCRWSCISKDWARFYLLKRSQSKKSELPLFHKAWISRFITSCIPLFPGKPPLLLTHLPPSYDQLRDNFDLCQSLKELDICFDGFAHSDSLEHINRLLAIMSVWLPYLQPGHSVSHWIAVFVMIRRGHLKQFAGC